MDLIDWFDESISIDSFQPQPWDLVSNSHCAPAHAATIAANVSGEVEFETEDLERWDVERWKLEVLLAFMDSIDDVSVSKVRADLAKLVRR